MRNVYAEGGGGKATQAKPAKKTIRQKLGQFVSNVGTRIGGRPGTRR